MSNNDLWCSKCKSQHHPAEDCDYNEEDTMFNEKYVTHKEMDIYAAILILATVGLVVLLIYKWIR